MNERRREPRYAVSQFGLKGSLFLVPDPEAISVQFNNISSSGVGLTIITDLTGEQEKKLFSLLASTREGRFVPVQLLFNNMKIPVNVMNRSGNRNFGFCLSKHEKLLELSEKGGQFFRMLAEAAVKKGASEADFVQHVPHGPSGDGTGEIAPTPAKAEPRPAGAMPEYLKDLPPNHPVAKIIKMRFDAFNRKVIFLRSLGVMAAPYYIDSYIEPDSAMKQVLGANGPLQKKTVYRWVPNELNLLIQGQEKTVAAYIENNFKQAMYAYMRMKKQNDIGFDQIMELYEGKLPRQFKPIRDAFLASVCELVEPEVQKKFDEFHADTNEDLLKARLVKEEEQAMTGMSPPDLVKNYLWGKINELGELAQYQKEAARSWVPKENVAKISQLANVVVLSRQSLDHILETTRGKVGDEDPNDWFDEVDLSKLYQSVVEVKGEKIRSNFRLYVDSLQPEFKRDILVSKVINSANWHKYYVLKKSKAYLGDIFGVKAPIICAYIEENMLTSSEGGEYV